MARFLFECARRSDLLDEMKFAGLRYPNDDDWRPIAPRAFGRLDEVDIDRAEELSVFILVGLRRVSGLQNASVRYGGGASCPRIEASLAFRRGAWMPTSSLL